jgi:hypothetical protein
MYSCTYNPFFSLSSANRAFRKMKVQVESCPSFCRSLLNINGIQSTHEWLATHIHKWCRKIVKKKEGKVVPVLTEAPCHEDVCGNGSMAPRFLTSAIDGGEWPSSCPGRFTPGERAPRYPLDRSWVGPRDGLGAGVQKNLLAPPEIESRPSSPQPADIPTELSWLNRSRKKRNRKCE